MKFSTLVSGAAALAATTLAMPTEELEARQLVPSISSFETITLEEAQAMVANQTEEVTFHTTDVTTQAARCSNPIQRVEWRNMSEQQKTKFINAYKKIWNAAPKGLAGATQATTRYEELVWVHQQMQHNIHQDGLFLPWHRMYVHAWAVMLRNEGGYTGPLPWWDEAKDTGNFRGSGLFNDKYFGPLPLDKNGQSTCIKKGAFGNRQLHIGPGTGYSTRCLARGEKTAATSQVTQSFVNTCNSLNAYDDMRECQEYGVHGQGHNGIGSVMSDVSSSPSDPIFFMHHTFIDRAWKKWQNVDSSRWNSISGCADHNNPCTPLTKNTMMSVKGIGGYKDRPVSDYLDTQNEYLCYVYDY